MTTESLAVPVTAEDVTRFQEDGAVCIRQIIDETWVERMRKAIVDVLGEPDPANPHFRQTLYAWKENDDFRDFAINSPLPAIAAKVLMSQQVNLFADHILVKDAGSSEPTPWHQDAPYWPLQGDQLCTIWVALDEVTIHSGGVQYVKGSHKWGKWYRPAAFKPGDDWEGPNWERIPDFDAHRDEYEFLHWDVMPGDCIIHHPLVVHGGFPNTNAQRARRAIAPRYAGDDVTWRNIPGKPRSAMALDDGQKLCAPNFPPVWTAA